MSQLEKFVAVLLSGQSDKNIDFDALCNLLLRLDFAQRIRGSHHIFTREGVEEIINLQGSTGGQAKPYQVKQVRELLQKYQLSLKPVPSLKVVVMPPPQETIRLKRKK